MILFFASSPRGFLLLQIEFGQLGGHGCSPTPPDCSLGLLCHALHQVAAKCFMMTWELDLYGSSL